MSFMNGNSGGESLRNKLIPIGQQQNAQRDKLTGQAQSGLNYFEGSDPTQSPLYKSLVTTGREGVAGGFNNASAAMKSRANQAGFGYNTPTEQGAQTQLDAAQGSAEAKVPGEALQQTIAPELQALSQTGNLAQQYNGAPYYGMATDIQKQNDSNTMQIWKQYLAGAQAAAGGAGA